MYTRYVLNTHGKLQQFHSHYPSQLPLTYCLSVVREKWNFRSPLARCSGDLARAMSQQILYARQRLGTAYHPPPLVLRSVSDRRRSGYKEANRVAIMEPMEWPAKWTSHHFSLSWQSTPGPSVARHVLGE